MPETNFGRGGLDQEVVEAVCSSSWETLMKISYDHEVDALYIRFKETTVTTKHLEDGIALDYDATDRLAGIEILDAMKRLENPEMFKQVVLEASGQ